MPRLTRLMVRTSLAYLVLAFLLGILLADGSPFDWNIPLGGFFPVYTHLLVIGWATQLIFAVAYWMFPKLDTNKPRGSDLLAWSTYWMLNIGLVLRMIGEPIQYAYEGPFLGWILVLSAILLWLSAVCFVLIIWNRVKER